MRQLLLLLLLLQQTESISRPMHFSVLAAPSLQLYSDVAQGIHPSTQKCINTLLRRSASLAVNRQYISRQLPKYITTLTRFHDTVLMLSC